MVAGPTNFNMRRTLRSFAIVALILLFGSAIDWSSECQADQLSNGSSNKKFKTQTLQSIPFEQLNEATRRKISDTLNKPSVYRRLPVTSITADPDYFRFLVRYPEVIVNVWQLMGVTKMETQRTGAYTVQTDDGAGTISSLELIYGSDDLHIYYGTGSYEGPIFRRKLTGSCVLVMRSESKTDAQGKATITNQLDVFLKIDNAAAGLIAKSIQPIIGTTADHNFVESLKFIERLNATTKKNGPGVQRMAQRLDLSSDVKQKMNDVVEVVFQRALNSQVLTESTRFEQRTFGQPAFGTIGDQQSRFQETRPSNTAAPSLIPQTQNSTLPARGYRAPVYRSGLIERLDHGSQEPTTPVQASFSIPRYYPPPNPVQRAGWYSR